MPVTLVYADHDWSRPAEREANLARIKRGRMLVLKDASHIASLERPEEFARILIENSINSPLRRVSWEGTLIHGNLRPDHVMAGFGLTLPLS